MRTLIILVGVRGAGKSTVLDRLRGLNDVLVLTPSTTREQRSKDDDEYNFISPEEWKSEELAWEITVGTNHYGMCKSELERISGSMVGVTVFDPGGFSVLAKFRDTSVLEVVTVGLDTIKSVEEQNDRVCGDASRIMLTELFEEQIMTIQRCDVVLQGDKDTIFRGVRSVIEILTGRGGIIPGKHIENLIRAGSIFEGGSPSNIPEASYDLSLGDDVWCQGRFLSLDDKQPTLRIPPYSYAIVSAREYARLPSFVVGRFDLKVSLFFNGVVLSNGPQVDPGYRGALFCMLYNGSDEPVGITRGQHFATIEFSTTTMVTAGYREHYQGKKLLSDFMPGHAAVAKGGQILERMQEIESSLRTEWHTVRNGAFTVLSVILTSSAIVLSMLWNVHNDLKREVVRLHDVVSTNIVQKSTMHTSEPKKCDVLGLSQPNCREGDGKTGRGMPGKRSDGPAAGSASSDTKTPAGNQQE